MDFHGMSRKDLQSLCKKHGIPANLKNSEMASRLASLFKKEDEETVTAMDFHGFKRKDLQSLCKKHGIPANLKNSEMANRLASLFEESQETLIFTDLKEHSSVDGSFVFTTRERNLMLMEQLSENGKIRAADTVTHHNDEAAESHEVVFTTREQVLLLGDSELYEVGKDEEHTDTDSEQKKAVKTAEKADAEFDDQCTAKRHPFPEESELEEAAKSKECKVVELQVDFDNFTGADITAKSHDMSDVLTASESPSLIGDFDPDGAENEYRETKDVGRHLLSGDSGLDETRKIKYNTAATCEGSPEKRQRLGNSEPHTAGNQEQKQVKFKDESAFFTRLESRLLLGESGQDSLGNGKSGSTQYQSHHASSPKAILKDDSVVPEGHVAAPDFSENTIADSSGSITQKVSYSHEFNAEEETAVEELATIGLEAAQGTSKQSILQSPLVNSANLSDFDTEGTEITMEAESTVTLSSYVLASPAEGDSKTIGEISSQLEVGGTCSMVLEESVSSTDIQNQLNDELEELAITDNDETGELIEAKATKNLDSFGQTCVLAGTEDQHFDYSSEVDFKNAEESGHKILKDEATDLIATAFAAYEEMVRRVATLSPDEALNESNENKESEKPNLIYRTQVKPKRHDMKENTPHSKIVENLNVTAPRTSKRQPLQDLRNVREEPNTVFKPTQIWKLKTSQPKHKTCNKEVSLLSTAQHIQTGNRFAVLTDYDDC